MEEGNGGVDEEQIAGDRGADRRVGSLEEGEAGGHRSGDPAVPTAPPPQILASCKKRKGVNEQSRKRKG